MAADSSSTARRLGIISAVAVVALLLAYAATLVVGLRSLESPQHPIGDPMFSVLEIGRSLTSMRVPSTIPKGIARR